MLYSYQTAPTVLLAILLMLIHCCNAQTTPCSPYVLNVNEGDSGSEVLLDLRPIRFSEVVENQQALVQKYFIYDEGVIRINRTIDRDDIASTLGETFLPVVLTIEYLAPMSVCYTVSIYVGDINNNVPIFPADSALVEIAEGGLKSVDLDRAVDEDEGTNSVVLYRLLDDMNGLFEIDVRMRNTGEIDRVLLRNTQFLDRENVSHYFLTLEASEGTANPRTDTMLLNVTVTDVCDESPAFMTSRYIPPGIPEDSPNGTVILHNITASDADIVDRDGLTYHINEVCRRSDIGEPCESFTDHPFVLDMENGLLTLEGSLDREEYAKYEVSVHATDQCMRSATATVNVLVIDVNDNCPQITFTSSVIGGEIRETFSDLPINVGSFGVTDRDSGDNGRFNVEFFEQLNGELITSNTFHLNTDSSTMLLNLVQRVDREMQSEYALVLRATDLGTPSCSSIFNLTLRIEDFNDNPPVFQRENILPMYTIQEELQVNYLIETLLANDADALESGSGLVTYNIPESNGSFPYQSLFKIENTTGNLKIAGRLDREEQDRLFVLVMASDNPFSNSGSNIRDPILSDFIVINITLEDSNDNDPIIHYPLGTIQVPEDFLPNTKLFSINATDLDITPSSSLTYMISSTDELAPFIVNSNGEVFLQSRLDFEETQQYDLTIRVSDGEHQTEESITIAVTNVNDKPPVFSPSSRHVVTNVQEENQMIGFRVATINATDPDMLTEGLRLQIVSGNELDHFTIDSVTGQITTTMPLDKEEVSNYTLTISVNDGELYAEENAIVFINVLDINDNPPIFSSTSYNFQVKETYPINTVVRGATEADVVRANDLDTGDNGIIRYEIIGAVPSVANDWFLIDQNTGGITTKVVLDREDSILDADGIVRISVEARNIGTSSLSNIAEVAITIADVNDESPFFRVPNVTISLSENYETGATFYTVMAIDHDQPPLNEIQYSILNSPPGIGSRFFINAMTGELSLLIPLNHENEERVEFRVQAEDPNEPIRQVTQTIIINVLDAQDPCLKFSDAFSPFISLQENSPLNTPVITFEATNLDGESVSSVVYTLTNLDGSPSNEFDIIEDQNLRATVHTVSMNIDREALISEGNSQPVYQLNITAHDTVSSLECVAISSVLTVTILDVNDNSPEFSDDEYYFSIVENLPEETPVGTVLATDSDEEENGLVTYALLSDSVIPFSINNDGQITSTQGLDHDAPSPSSYTFTVVAQDSGTDPMSSAVTVRVEVLDVNDNDPVFDRNQNRTFVIPEDTATNQVIATILVSDLDSGTNGEVTVSLNQGSRLDQHFQLQQDGSIYLAQQLDREREASYSFEVRARDGGGRTSTAMISIAVQDVNDNPPIFNLEPIDPIQLSEDFPTLTVFTTVTATDQDIGLNGEVSYALEDDSFDKTFCMHRTMGEIFLCAESCTRPSDNRIIRAVDYERNSSYVLTVFAYDQSFPRHFASRTIEIEIINVNEHGPVFDSSSVAVYVDEGKDAGTEVVQIQAYDWDYDRLTYSIWEGDSISANFRYQNGAIVTSSSLDYNVKDMYFLSLMAQELSTAESKHATILVTVIVKNINNHFPVFDTMDYATSTEISESTEVGSVVLTVQATDADNSTHDAVSYQIKDGNVANAFTIDSHTGDVSVNSLLDYDNVTSYLLTVVATDTGCRQRSSTSLELSITLQNINDESPIFSDDTYEFELTENSRIGSIVGRVEAPDRDREPYGDVKYSLLDGDNGYFNVQEDTGDVVSLVEFDRENLANPTITFTVSAADSGGQPIMTASTQVTVRIVDANDNPPTFSRYQYYVHIIQSQEPGVSIFSLGPEVSDLDDGENAASMFEVVTQLSGNLIQVSSSGEVMIRTSLPSELVQIYEAEVRVFNTQNPTMGDTAIVRIVVEANNDHHPRFDQLEGYSVDISEDLDVGSSVFDLSEYASDPDSGTNGDLSFQFQEFYSQFSVNSESGLITLRETVDYETDKTFPLKVAVFDNTQGTRRTAETMLTVIVTSVNDNSPVFDNVPSSLVISPVPGINIDLFTVRATDADEGSDGIVGYSVSENGTTSVYFAIDPLTGIVKSKGPIASGSEFTLTFTAYDNGEPLRSSIATIIIAISGEATPLFVGVTPPIHTINVEENREPGPLHQFFTSPQAESFKLVYSDAPSNLFSISSTQGMLILQGQLDYLERSEYELVIEARNEDSRDLNNIIRLSSYLRVNIQVMDVNNKNPQFVLPGTVISISEDADIGSFVYQVRAIDEDSGVNGELNYEISDGNLERVFNINETSGEITLRGNLDRETYSFYDLTVRAFDLSNRPNIEEITLHIEVRDVNDYTPRFVKDGNYTIGVYEHPHTKSGDGIIRVFAIDLDEGRPLRYEIFLREARYKGNLVSMPFQDTFTINRDTGLISVAVDLDFETVDYYLLLVEALDSPTTVTTYVEIHILDVNDHSPDIILPTDITVWEQQPVGSLVSKISSTDIDAGINGLVTYSLGEEWSQQVPDTFVIDPHTGVIRVKRPLVSRLNLFTFSATVNAIDQGSPPKTTSGLVHISVLDVNDHSPVFEQESYVFPISINTSPNMLIGSTVASDDEDFRENSGVSYIIPHYYNEANMYFSLDHMRGRLTLRTTQGLTTRNYTFRVKASNPSFCPTCPQYQQVSYAEVTVVVYPMCPEFQTQLHSIDILEEDLSPDMLLQLLAVSSVGRQVEYFFNDSLERPFNVERSSGQLTLSSALDRETVNFYEFFVAATDSPFQSLTCSAQIRITVLDINDNRPTFMQDEYTESVLENLEPPIFVGTVLAADPDLDENGTVRYELASTDVPFTVDGQSGEIYSTEMFNTEAIESYMFTVRAFDNGVQVMTGSVTVRVTIADVNEFKPIFEMPTYTFNDISPSRYSTGDIVGTITVNDEDKRSQLVYSFVNDEPKLYFEINPSTGDIILIATQSGSSATVTKRSIQKRQTDNSEYFPVKGIVLVTDGTNNVTTEVDFSLHNSFRVEPTTEPFNITIIIAVVVALVVAVIAVFLVVLIIAFTCRQRRISRKVQIKDSAVPNNMELESRFSSRRSHGSRSSTPSQYRQTSTNNPYSLGHTTLHHSSGSGSNSSRQSYSNYADDEMDSSNGDPLARTAYNSPGLSKKPPNHPSPHTRSTSDLASSVGTDMLGSQQLPHPKARIAAIYAKNHELLGSRESIHSNHTFASEGGGEADAEADINNMLYSKYEFEDDDDDDVTTLPDDSSYIGGKDSRSLTDSAGNMNVPPVEEDMPPYSYSQTMNGWVPRATPMEHAITELSELASYSSSQEHHVPVSRYHEHSQPVSMYGGASSQSSRISLLRHQHPPRARHYDIPPQMVQQMPHEYEYYAAPPQDPRHMMNQQRYGSANALSIPSDYGHGHPREHISSRGDPRVDPRLRQSRGHPSHIVLSQDVPPTYLQQSHYLPRGANTQTPSSDTPTDGTVTPHHAMAAEFDHGDYLSSSSTSIGSTNLSGTASSIGQSASQRMYQK